MIRFTGMLPAASVEDSIRESLALLARTLRPVENTRGNITLELVGVIGLTAFGLIFWVTACRIAADLVSHALASVLP